MLSVTIIFVEKKYEVYYNIGLSVSTSVLATSIVQIIQLFTELIEKFTNQRMFLELFGCDDKKNGHSSIAIVVPAYELKPEYLQANANTFKEKAQKLVSRSSIKAAINNDVTAASCLGSAFSKLGLPVPPIKSDTEININDGVKTYILIGLSNYVIEEKLYKSSSDRYFSIDYKEDSNGYLSEVIIKTGSFDNNHRLTERRNWTPFTVPVNLPTAQSKDTTDYALFAKCSINKKLFIVCGGGTEGGTFEIGTYISDNGWRHIYNELKQEKNTDITPHDAYAVVFQLSKSSISIERKCIRRNN